MVRTKFKCVRKVEIDRGDQPSTFEVRFEIVLTGSTENDAVFRDIPAGTASLLDLNKSAADDFELGGEYFLDFSGAE